MFGGEVEREGRVGEEENTFSFFGWRLGLALGLAALLAVLVVVAAKALRFLEEVAIATPPEAAAAAATAA